MPTFADTLLQGQNDAFTYARAEVRQNAEYWEQAIRTKCTANRNSRYISGFLQQYFSGESACIIDKPGEICSAQDFEKSLKKKLEKPVSVHKQLHYQDTAGKNISTGIYTCSPENSSYFHNALNQIIANLGFSNYRVTLVPLKRVERTITPASLFSPIQVTDKIVGSCYAFHIEIRW